MICYIQQLEQVKDGWHIRFGGPGDFFWTMLSQFKFEQKQRGLMFCHFDPSLFGRKGGWFCTDAILEKYASQFDNYAEKREEAEEIYKESGKAEAARKEKEARAQAEKERKEREARWKAQQEEELWKYARQQKQANWQKEQSYQKPVRPPSTALTLTEAKSVLGFSPVAQLTELEVKKAFRLKAMTTHPDHGGSHEGMIRLNQAYQLVLFSIGKVGARI